MTFIYTVNVDRQKLWYFLNCGYSICFFPNLYKWPLPSCHPTSQFSITFQAGRWINVCVYYIYIYIYIHFWKLSFAKFAPRLRARAIWKSKSLKTGGVGALLEVDIDKICTTPARESDLEVKIVKTWHARSTFGSWASQNLHHACARERFGSQNR